MKEGENKEEWARVEDTARKLLGTMGSTAVEQAYNADIPVVVPAIPGLTATVSERQLDIERTADNILNDPRPDELAAINALETDEDRLDWARKRAIEIAEKEGYVEEEGQWVKR